MIYQSIFGGISNQHAGSCRSCHSPFLTWIDNKGEATTNGEKNIEDIKGTLKANNKMETSRLVVKVPLCVLEYQKAKYTKYNYGITHDSEKAVCDGDT